MDRDPSAWLIVEADSKEEARYLVPSAFLASATVFALNKFSMEQIDSITVMPDTGQPTGACGIAW
jgi:hypothetical protein